MGIRHGSSNYLSTYKDLSRTLLLLAADTPTTVGADFLAGRAGYTIYIVKITCHVVTAAAQALTFQDDNSTPIVVATLPASAAAGDEHILFDAQNGPGVPLTEGKNLDITGTAGVKATIVVVAYLKPTATLTGGKRGTSTV
jgi:hypothetical protein